MEISHSIQEGFIVGSLKLNQFEILKINPLFNTRQNIIDYLHKLSEECNYNYIGKVEVMELADLEYAKRIGFRVRFEEKTEEQIQFERLEFFISRLDEV